MISGLAGPSGAWSQSPYCSSISRPAPARNPDSASASRKRSSAVPPALPGQFLVLRVHVSDEERPLLRSYSLSGAPGATTYRISVKLEPHGAASQYVHSHVRAGDQLEAAAPRGTFILAPGATPVLLISAGVGATPVMAMLHALAADQTCRDVWWLHGARSGPEEPFASESKSLVAGLAHGHRCISYSRPGPDDLHGNGYRQGRLSADVLSSLGLPPDADAYICGPASFMADASAALVSIGLDAARIHTEIFGAAPPQTPGIAATSGRQPHQLAGEPGSGQQIAFARSGLTVPWDPGYASLLELAEACDVPVRWSCRTGVCHTCETSLVSGSVAYSPDPVDDPGDGSVLICCSQPRDDLVLDL
jgi:ferredoxin-NADP reductase